MGLVTLSDSSERVIREGLAIGARLKADGSLSDTAQKMLAERKAYKSAIRARQDAEDEVIIADAVLDVVAGRTDDAMVLTGSRIAGRLAQPGVPGEKDPQFTTFFEGKAPSALLPASRDDRNRKLDDLLKRLQPSASPAPVVKDGQELSKAIVAEQGAIQAKAKADGALAAARTAEAGAKAAVCTVVRASDGEVTAKFAENPAHARRIMGRAAPGGAKRKRQLQKVDPSGKDEKPAEPPQEK